MSRDLDINLISTKDRIDYTIFDFFYELINCNQVTSNLYKFWSDFENSLSLLDHDMIMSIYGKEDEDIVDLYEDLHDSYAIIRKIFSKWISSIKIQPCKAIYNFGNCLFINFNYTDTLCKRFGVDKRLMIHVHGEAQKEESIVFGHGCKIEKYTLPLWARSERMLESQIIYSHLHFLYKDINKYWYRIENFIKHKTINVNNISDIYVLGHSLGKIDLPYFLKLHKFLNHSATWHFSYYKSIDNIKQFCKSANIIDPQIDKIETIMEDFKIDNKIF